jgi:hypothetical protein
MALDLKAFIGQVAMHAWTAMGADRQGEYRTYVGELHHVLLLGMAGRTVAPGEEPALADT